MRYLVPRKVGDLVGSLWMILATLLFASTVHAQYLLEIGAPTFTTPESVPMGFVNVANGNLHIEIPIVSYPQRGGGTFVAKMVYDSRIWKIVDNGSSQTWQPTNVPEYPLDGSSAVYKLGWRFLVTGGGKVVSDTVVNECQSGGETYYWWKYQNYRFYDPASMVRKFPLYYETSNDCHTGSGTTSSGPSLDATGYLAKWTTYVATVEEVLAPDGTKVFNFAPGSTVAWRDPNGNQISKDTANKAIIDTLDRTALQETLQSNRFEYAVPTSQGNSTYKVYWFGTCRSVSTNFGVSGVTEFSSSCINQYVISMIQLPDGSTYNSTYESDYGLLSSVTLPSGGTIQFTHTNFTDAQGNVQRRANTVIVNGSTTTYTPATCGANCNKVTVSRPSGDETVYTFALNSAGAWNTETKSYTGTAASGTLMLTVNRTYDTSLSNPVTGGIGFVRPASTTTTIPGASGNLVSKTEATFDTFPYSYRGTNYTASRGNVLTNKDYAYGSGTPGSLLRQQVFTYLPDANSSYIAKNIINRVNSAQVKDPAGNKITESISVYDSGSLTAVSGVTHHDTTNFGTAYTLRGNPTETKVWTGSGSSTVCANLNYLCSTVSYDVTGQVRSATDPNGNSTTMSYTDSYFQDNGQNPPATYSPTPPTTNAFITQITRPLLGSSSAGYYYGSGRQAFATDINNRTSYFHFQDPLDRPTKAYAPGGGWSQRTYTSATQLNLTASITGSMNATRQVTVNPSTRTRTSTLTSDPSGDTSATSTWDTAGRPVSFSNPFRSGDTVVSQSVQYDGLNRVTRTTLQDNNYTETFYGPTVGGAGGRTSQLCSTSTYGIGYPTLTKDEAGKKRQTWMDALGRLIEVDEPDSSGALTLGTCYKYDVLGNLIQVDQGVQTRTMAYDAMGRLATETTPEGGTINLYYTTSGGALCAGNPSLPCRVTDARSITTTYTYDALNRLTGKSYSNGDPAVSYSYDQTSCNGLTITNGKGRRTCMTDASGTTAWSYDAEGRVLTEKRTIGNVTKTLSYTYNLNGSVNRITYPSGLQVQHYYSTAGRLMQLQCANVNCNTINFANGALYAASGALKEVVLGYVSGGFAGVKRTFTYNNRLQPVNLAAKHTNDTVTLLDYTYSFTSGSLNDGLVKSVTNNLATGRSQTYTYDEMNRLKTAKSTATSGSDCWGLDYTYDRYANLTHAAISSDRGGAGCAAPTLSLSIDPTTNQITNTGFQYDAAGNLTNNGFSTYTWNAEGRMASTAGVTYTYDGDGLRVKKSDGRLYWYSVGGALLAESDLSGNVISEYIFFGGMRIARRDVATGNVYYYLSDRLGNARVLTNSTGGVVEESDFYPFGVERPIIDTLNNKFKFTGYERDAESGLDHTLFRQYSCNTGRWLSPDSVRGRPTNPQSWNRYAYVQNGPTNAIDPDGTNLILCTDYYDNWEDGRFVRRDCQCISGCGRTVRIISFDAWDWGEQKTPQDILDEIQDDLDRPIEDLAYKALRGLADRMDSDCARALGFDGDGGLSELRSILRNAGVTLANMTPIIWDPVDNEVFEYKFAGIMYAGESALISLNRNINWFNPGANSGFSLDGQYSSDGVDLLGGLVPGQYLTPSQYLNFVLIHEISHINGIEADVDRRDAWGTLFNSCRNVIGE